MEEIWKEYGAYLISNKGNVLNKKLKREVKLITFAKNYNGYKVLRFSSKCVKKNVWVHVLVAKLFVDNPYNYEYVVHIDGDIYNNSSDNLAWCNHCECIDKDLDGEIWKPIKGFSNYEVSSKGRVRVLERFLNSDKTEKSICRVVSTRVNSDGYPNAFLVNDKTRLSKKVHRLVAEAFIPNPSSKKTVDHINGIKTDNRIENLRWATNYENMNNPVTKKVHRYSCGSEHYMAKQVCAVSKDGEVKLYDCMSNAAKSINGNHTGIVHCCKGRTDSYKGFKWYYKCDYERIKREII